MQNFDIMAEHGNATGSSVIARVAVFKGINTAQFQAPFVIAREAQRIADHGFVKKLQTFVMTGIPGSLHADFTCLEAIKPEPDAKGCQNKEQQFSQIHHPSIRNKEIEHGNYLKITG